MFPDLTVAENIFMGRQPLRSLRRIDRKAMRQQALELFEQLGSRSIPTGPRKASRLPTSKSWKSPRPFRSTRAS